MEWYRIDSEEEFEYFIRGGWTNFIIRPYGDTMWVYINEDLFNRQRACLSLPNFRQKGSPSWNLFREIADCAHREHICVPGPLSAHDLAQLEVGKNKCKNVSNC
jgi:hypothetical protein